MRQCVSHCMHAGGRGCVPEFLEYVPSRLSCTYLYYLSILSLLIANYMVSMSVEPCSGTVLLDLRFIVGWRVQMGRDLENAS